MRNAAEKSVRAALARILGSNRRNRSVRLGGLAVVAVTLLGGGMTVLAAGTAPVLQSTSPASGASVQSAPNVAATYDQPLHASSTLVVKDATNVAIAGATTFASGGSTVVFTPGSALTPAGSPYTATATAKNAGNDQQTESTWSFSIDAAAPAAPGIGSVGGDSTSPATGSDTSPEIVVSGLVAGDTARVLVAGVERAAAVVPEDATTVTFNAGAEEDVVLAGEVDHSLRATAADPAGNVSAPSAVFVYTLDTSAPAKPTIASVNGSASSPVTGSDPTPAIVVSGVMGGDTVRILEGATVKGTKVVPAPAVPGATSVTFNPTAASTDVTLDADGDHTLIAEAVDAAGNASPTSTAFVYTLDTGSPTSPTISSVHGVNATPAVGNDLTPAIVVSGVEAGDEVRVFEGATLKATKTVAAGASSVTFNGGVLDVDVVLTGDGDHTLTATSTDPQGNESGTSPGFVYTIDTGLTAPALVSTSPASSSTGQPPVTVSATYDERLDRARSTFSLTNSLGNSVGGTIGFSADARTIVFTPASTLTEGGNAYTARAVVRDGNGNETTSTWTFTVDATAPAAPTITSVNGTPDSPVGGNDPTPTITVSGAEAGHTVRILEGTTERGAKVVPGGATSVTFNAGPADAEVVVSGDGPHSLTATSTDPSGNTSPASAAFVYALTTTFPGEFHSLVPSRVLDTRDGTGGFNAPVGPSGTISPKVTGVGGVPATGVAAVVLNVTVTQPTAPASYLTVFPNGTTRPEAASLTFAAGQTVPNLVVAKVGADGRVSVYNLAGTSHVIFDVTGWFADAAAGPPGAFFNPLTPARVLDTRNGTGGFSAPVGAGGTIAPVVTGVGGVPASGVSAVVLNVTVTQPTAAASYLTAFPTGAARPNTANLTFVAGQTVSNLVVAKVGTGGKVSVYNLAGTSHVIFDVVGWFGTDRDEPAARYTALTPARTLDTRNGTGGVTGPVGPGGTVSPVVTGVGGVPVSGVSAVVLNVSVTQPTAAGSYLTVFPAGAARPNTANLTFTAGQTVTNLVMAKVGADGKVSVYNLAGTSHVIFDVVGWYSE